MSATPVDEQHAQHLSRIVRYRPAESFKYTCVHFVLLHSLFHQLAQVGGCFICCCCCFEVCCPETILRQHILSKWTHKYHWSQGHLFMQLAVVSVLTCLCCTFCQLLVCWLAEWLRMSNHDKDNSFYFGRDLIKLPSILKLPKSKTCFSPQSTLFHQWSINLITTF